MPSRHTATHSEEGESYLETFLDVLLCGLGAALALLIVYSVLPKGGAALQQAREEAPSGPTAMDTGISSAGTDTQSPVVLINVWGDSAMDLNLPTMADSFKLFTGNASSYPQTVNYASMIFGNEQLFRISSADQPIVLAVNSNLVVHTTFTVGIKLFINGEICNFSISVTPPSNGTSTRFKCDWDIPFKKTEQINPIPSCVPLFKLTPSGELIRLEVPVP